MEVQFYYADKKGKIHTTSQFEKWKAGLKNAWHAEYAGKDGTRISTISWGLDISTGKDRIMYPFETVIFRGKDDEGPYRYKTLREAKREHNDLVRACKTRMLFHGH